MQKPGLIQGGPPPNTPVNVMGRKEVPLPSQEGKQGVLQYALFVLVFPLRETRTQLTTTNTAQPLTKLPTGRANPLSGP